MNIHDRDKELVADLQDFTAHAKYLVNKGLAELAAQTFEGATLRYASHMLIINVATAVDQLSETYRDNHPQVAWRAIKDMRNRLAHKYTEIDLDIVWDSLSFDIPELARSLD